MGLQKFSYVMSAGRPMSGGRISPRMPHFRGAAALGTEAWTSKGTAPLEEDKVAMESDTDPEKEGEAMDALETAAGADDDAVDQKHLQCMPILTP